MARKPSRKQKNLARLTLEHPIMPKGKLVEAGGYGPAVIKTPAKALESKGYLEALAEFGLTDELITKSLVSDIKSKPKKRERELRLGAEIRGLTKGDKSSGANITNILINFSDQNDPPAQVSAETLPDTPTPGV